MPEISRLSNGLYFIKTSTTSGKACFRILRQVAAIELDTPPKSAPVVFEKTTLGALVVNIDNEPVILKLATSSNMFTPGRERDSNMYLYKPIWNERIKAIAPLLKMKLGAIYDSQGDHNAGPECVGNWHAAHVEKKLSVLAVYIARDYMRLGWKHKLRRDHLREMSRVIRRRGHRFGFQIVLQRAPCVRCEQFVGRLCHVSGVDMTIHVRPELRKCPEATYRDPGEVKPAGAVVQDEMLEQFDDENDIDYREIDAKFKKNIITDEELSEDVADDDAMSLEVFEDIHEDTPPPPSAGIVQGFHDVVQGFSHTPARQRMPVEVEPLFKKTTPRPLTVNTDMANRKANRKTKGQEETHDPRYIVKPLPATPVLDPPSPYRHGPIQRQSQSTSIDSSSQQSMSPLEQDVDETSLSLR
ncbi:hypothetical protein ACHAQA_008847 [Verticillium albo-atrum]